jgi:hypothetical protein
MESKATKGLSLLLLAAVIFLSVCDVLIVCSSPFWLRTLYQINFAGLRVMMGYNYAIGSANYPLMLAFFIVSGLLCLGILVAAYRILRRILKSVPFCGANAVSLRNAAVCAFGLFAVFMLKQLFSPSILSSVCGGIFLLFGLFVLVMAQLVRSAVRLKEENDLTI